mgnify:CR=1 FL=1
MGPEIGRIAFNIGITLLILALIPLFIIERNSAAFVVDVLSILIIIVFLILVTWDVRRQVKKSLLK